MRGIVARWRVIPTTNNFSGAHNNRATFIAKAEGFFSFFCGGEEKRFVGHYFIVPKEKPAPVR